MAENQSFSVPLPPTHHPPRAFHHGALNEMSVEKITRDYAANQKRKATAPKRPATTTKKTRIVPVTTLITSTVAEPKTTSGPSTSAASGSREATQKTSTSAETSDPMAVSSAYCLLGAPPKEIKDPDSLQQFIDLFSSPSRRATETRRLVAVACRTLWGVAPKRRNPVSAPPVPWPLLRPSTRQVHMGPSSGEPQGPPTNSVPAETSSGRGRIRERGDCQNDQPSAGSSSQSPGTSGQTSGNSPADGKETRTGHLCVSLLPRTHRTPTGWPEVEAQQWQRFASLQHQ
ncbi:hypothetical protein DMENIID0001_040780 [Sergentomyia squamirostris]